MRILTQVVVDVELWKFIPLPWKWLITLCPLAHRDITDYKGHIDAGIDVIKETIMAPNSTNTRT